MFGYVIPDKDNMLIKDFNVFQSFYCGLCKSLHKTGSEITRLCTNYDVTFYSVLMHEILKKPVKFERKLCVYNGKKKVIVTPDGLSLQMADLAVLLVYYNIKDDVADGKKLRAPLVWRLVLRKRKASRNMPKIDELMREKFGLLATLEKEKCDSIDRVADTFASLMRDITRELISADEQAGENGLTEDEKRVIDDFCYNLGRLVYIMDAVDDVEKDSKKGSYNPLVINYGVCDDKVAYLEKNEEELSFLLKSTYNKLVGAYNAMNVKLYEGVLSNTIYLGIDMQIQRLLKGEQKCQITRL